MISTDDIHLERDVEDQPWLDIIHKPCFTGDRARTGRINIRNGIMYCDKCDLSLDKKATVFLRLIELKTGRELQCGWI